jgi:serine protease Do
VASHNPGDKVSVMLLRDGKEIQLPLNFLSDNGNTSLLKVDKIQVLGATFQSVSDDDKNRFGLQNGFKIIHLENGKLRNAGIREGFIVVAIDNHPVASLEDLKQELTEKRGGVLLEGLYTNGLRAYYGVGL